jgi:DNA-binding NarL/FixJ family response regulator
MKEMEPCQETPAAVIILDLNSRYYNGIEWMQELKNAKPSAKWLACSIQDNEMIIRALQSGDIGYIMNENSPLGLKHLLRGIVHDTPLIPPQPTEHLNPFYRKLPKKTSWNDLLSGREKEILQFISKGLLYKEIGEHLGIQKGTVKKHVAKIYEKLQVQNKIEALNKFYGLLF